MTDRKTEVDLTNCDLEPIHIPGLIQDHGFLLVVERLSCRITRVSENIEKFLAVSFRELLDKPLSTILEDVEDTPVENWINRLPSIPVHIEVSLHNGKRHYLSAHKIGDEAILEFEPAIAPEKRDSAQLLLMLSNATDRLRRFSSTQETLDELAEEVRNFTAYDRVMVYRFDEDWHGEVIAESKSPEIKTSFLNQHFPASDIPKQARILYEQKLLRILVDVDYKPVPIHQNGTAPDSELDPKDPLDMSQCMLRSVSPIHIEYLQNMGVKATLVISILDRGKLWGLLACHHYSGEKRVSLMERLACLCLANLAGVTVEARLQEEIEKQREFHELRLQQIKQALQAHSGDLLSLCKENLELLKSQIDSEAFACVTPKKIITVGEAPRKKSIRGLAMFLKTHGIDNVFATNRLVDNIPDAEELTDVVAGVLAIPADSSKESWLIWMRKEKRSTRSWAGDPRKPELLAGEDRTKRLTPRKSFESWEEEVRNTSLPFRKVEADHAAVLRQMLTEHDLRITKAMSDEVTSQKELFSAIVESSRDAIIGFDLKGRIVTWNMGASELFGISGEEAKKRSFTHILNDYSDLFPAELSAMDTFERQFVRSDGQKLELSIKLYPLQTGNGNNLYGAAIIRDITLQKQAERELLLMSEQLVESNQQLEEYAWMAAHDLKEPVRTMGTYARLLKDEFGSELPDEARELLHFIYNSSSNAMNKIDDILKYSSLNKEVIDGSPLDLKVVIDSVLSELRRPIEENDASIVVTDLPPVAGKPELLALLFQNLISNSLKFRSENKPLIKIKGKAKKDFTIISISDNGIGISAEDSDQVFGMFKRLRPDLPGTGLGMSIAKRIVDLHRGEIWYEGSQGNGTTFFVKLPTPDRRK